MKKQAIVIGAMLAAGVAVAAVIVGMPSTGEPGDELAGELAGETVESAFDGSAGLEERVKALEAAVSAEREARQLLEDELFILYEVIESLEAPGPATGTAEPARAESRTRQRAAQAAAPADDIERRRAALTTAGFAPDRADWILQRESELRMEAMRARFEQMRNGDPTGPFNRAESPDSLLRAELGDAEYEMYLDAVNRPTSVGVSRVLASSPAQSAGLEAGDRITHYDGERVFSTFDLTRQAIAGEPGESVVVGIERDGVPMQVVLPRGPLGIATRRGRGR